MTPVFVVTLGDVVALITLALILVAGLYMWAADKIKRRKEKINE